MSDIQTKLIKTAPDSHHHPSCGIRAFNLFGGNLGIGLCIECDADGRGGINV
jgi:hypothetical protein